MHTYMQLCILSAELLPRTSKGQTLLHSTCVAMQMPLTADVEWQVLFKGHALPTGDLQEMPDARTGSLSVLQQETLASMPELGSLMALPKRKKSPSPMLGLEMSPRMPEGGWFTPMVLPGMFSRKNRKSWEQFVGGNYADPSAGCETWAALLNRFDLAKTSFRKTPRTMNKPFPFLVYPLLRGGKGIRGLSLPLMAFGMSCPLLSFHPGACNGSNVSQNSKNGMQLMGPCPKPPTARKPEVCQTGWQKPNNTTSMAS